MKILRQILIIAVMASSHTFSGAYAEKNDLHLIKTFTDWYVFKGFDQAGLETCYAVTEPKRTRIFSGLRKQPYFAVRYVDKDSFAVSTFPGFHVDQTKEVILYIGRSSYAMAMGDGSFVWPATSVGDVSIINAFMLNGDYFRVQATNRQGQPAIDYYSLKGLYRSLQYMGEECW